MRNVLKSRYAVSLEVSWANGKDQAVTLNKEAVSECEALLALMKLHTPALSQNVKSLSACKVRQERVCVMPSNCELPLVVQVAAHQAAQSVALERDVRV